MARETKYVSEHVLTGLVEAGAIVTAYILEDSHGQFHIVLRSSAGIDHRLAKKRGGARTFKSLNAAAGLIRAMGIARIHLHMCEFAPGHAPSLLD